MARKRRFTALVIIASLLVSGVAFWEASTARSAPLAANPYHDINPRLGVYNDGKAAFWDLSFVDHFWIFGAPERAIGHNPQQPIAFSHVRHVQQNKMECQYCHWSVAKGAFAALPEEETCMGCHKIIAGGSEGAKSDATEEQKKAAAVAKDEVKKLVEFYNKGTPVPWKKVHVMPDFVRFNHKRHVKAGVACQECHGQVPAMPVVERVSSMKMGWCVSCHRERGASIDCAVCHK